jgi:GDP-L-fucose synthase
MRKDARVYVAGHRGLAGSAILRRLQSAGFSRLITRTHSELDLADAASVRRFFDTEKPQFVFLAAAKVGGILANDAYPADFIQQNLAIQTNVIHESWRSGVERLLFLGSSCIYPRDCPQPIREEYLLTGPLEQTNRPYAIAKIAGVEMCSSYNRQYGTRFLAAMPTNLYGPGDSYDLQNSHELRGDREVVVWGTGTPRREFLFSADMADACVHLMSLDDSRFSAAATAWPPLVNVGSGTDLAIAELAQCVAGVVGFEGRLRFDRTRPDGTPRKLLNVERLQAFGWQASTPLEAGIGLAYRDFLARFAAA